MGFREKEVLERMVVTITVLYDEMWSHVKPPPGNQSLESACIKVIDKAAIESCKKLQWELLHQDDLALTSESEQEVMEAFKRWRQEKATRGLKVNFEKTEVQ